jgi:hypothetical protein
MSSPRLTRDEEGQLRRLHFFEALGVRLDPSLRLLKQQLRMRDRRHSVREPADDRVLWGV